MIRAIAAPCDVDAVAKIILAELRSLRTSGPSDFELEDAKARLATAIVVASEGNTGLVNRWTNAYLDGVAFKDPNVSIGEIQHVRRSHVAEVIGRYLHENQVIVSIASPWTITDERIR
jgi:predicted Zn-dependent peptidase